MDQSPANPAEGSIFDKIVKGEVPAHKVYENESVLAFLDIHAAQTGYTLVIPKRPVQFVWDLPAADYQALMAAAQLIAHRLREVLGVPYVGERIVGVDVPYAHVHLVPFSTTEEYSVLPSDATEPNHDALAETAAKLQF